ncbi:homoserine dehydrogenase [Cognatilysobacter terrigena]|uniref:homoserine dehydrogenase n=1 Tax=Cognatilysobacter terrigena TaxID=2488749 RepID=UPI001FE95771|nr:homoserine dehydrogenase [Lysobacter terrigena]
MSAVLTDRRIAPFPPHMGARGACARTATTTIALGLIGPGKVGRALLAQWADVAPRLRAQGVDVVLRGVMDRRRMWLGAARGSLDAVMSDFDAAPSPDVHRFGPHLVDEGRLQAVVIDCSGSDEVVDHYARWLSQGLHVVTPSKRAGSGPIERWHAIRNATRNGARFRHEASVGAGLPVIQTLRSQLDTGDDLLGVDGVLSGTLAWLFHRFDGSRPFSHLVREAHDLGYTEPDPRDDLSGLDVARKLVILAREAGHSIALDDVEVESLVPAHLREVPPDAFLAQIDALDAPMQARFDAARERGRALRYVASFDGRDARVGLAMPGPDDATSHGRLTDNLIRFRTRRYADNPLVVQGPGAGPEVTAAGVFGDVLAIAQYLGARL